MALTKRLLGFIIITYSLVVGNCRKNQTCYSQAEDLQAAFLKEFIESQAIVLPLPK